jgi:hypothetical protein
MKKYKSYPKEEDEQQTVVDWLRAKRWRFTFIVNSGKMKVQYRMKLLRQGLSPGVPDLMVIHPKNYLIFIEMKRIKGSVVSPEQKEWIEDLNKIDNVSAVICKGAEEAINYLNSIK